MTSISTYEKAQEFITCPYCGAGPKMPCRTKNGSTYAGKWYLHASRTKPFKDEWTVGYFKGIERGREIEREKE